MQDQVEMSGIGFIINGGFVSIVVAVMLLAMSITSWYLIISRTVKNWQDYQKNKQYTQKFWSQNSIDEVKTDYHDSAIGLIAMQSITAAEHYQRAYSAIDKSIKQDVFIASAINRVLIEQAELQEKGLSMLASIGSIAPFIGLFGTVWGIYHALIGISQTGQASLNQVAGPVGEALIMTAIGLAVAIPAVLAYNGLIRQNRKQQSLLEKFAYDIHTLLVTGAPIQTSIKTKEKDACVVNHQNRSIGVSA